MNPFLYILFFAFSILILIQFIFDPNVIVNNDLNGNIVPLLHFKESIFDYHKFPQWNPYINQGIPIISDPLYGIYNPLISIPILIFPYQSAIKVTYFASLFIACISMFLLLRLYKISNVSSTIIALTYASGTYFASRIVAGHLEKVVSFALLPLFLYCLIKIMRAKNVLWAGLGAIVISLILFSGDIYNALFCLYSLAAVFIYSLFKDKKASFYIFLTGILFLLFSSIKIIPMIELQNYISKIKEPYIGDLNLLSLILNLFLPFDDIISKIFPSQTVSTGFGWWESLAFIGPIATLGLIYIIKALFTKRGSELSLLIVLTVLFFLLSTPGSLFNPIRYITYIIEPLQYFHVPSRILALWGIVILVSLGIFIDKWKRRKLAISLLLINLIIVFTYSQYVLFTRKFEKIDNTYSSVLSYIAKINKDNYYSVHETNQGKIPQDKAYINNLFLLQSNYGLFLKGSLGEKYNYKGDNKYNDIKAGYLISSTNTKNSNLEKIKEFNNNIILYKDLRALPFAQIDGRPQSVTVSADKIIVTADSKETDRLTLLETNYPGWSVFIDGIKGKIKNGRFLEVETLPGKHKYEFIYSSNYFYFGLFLTSVSLLTWLLYIFYNSSIISKKRLKKS